MSKYCNYHMHTTFCDGANSAADMAAAAYDLGCPEVGFSGHSYLPFDTEWTMSPEATESYCKCIAELKEQYAGKMSIRLGTEQDYCSDTAGLERFEYVIGGVHCVFKDGHYISVDGDAEKQREGIEKWYGGDAYAFVEDYYQLVADLYPKTRCNIIAHFDLITKFVEKDPTFDPEDRRYREAAERALQIVSGQPVALEINTGAISRGYRTEPYPAAWILQKLGESGVPGILSSDAHSTRNILFGFTEAMELVRKYHLNLFPDLDSLLAWERPRSG